MHERDISKQLAQREDGQCEVRTPVGFIDVLTPTIIYEVKEVTDWKAAVGQLLAYARYYPNHKPKLYLYGQASGTQKQVIKEHCKELRIVVVWHKEELIPSEAPQVIAPLVAAQPDHLRLHLLVIDHAEHRQASCSVQLALPTTPLSEEALAAYADEALAVQ